MQLVVAVVAEKTGMTGINWDQSWNMEKVSTRFVGSRHHKKADYFNPNFR
jgi:hypothetical protein